MVNGEGTLNFSKGSFRLTRPHSEKSGVFLFFEIRDIVQLVEWVLWEHQVVSSSLAIPTNTGCEREVEAAGLGSQ